MQFHRYGHMAQVFVKLGDVVKKGQIIGTIGDGNGQYKGAAHVHYDCPNKTFKDWWQFPIGQAREQIKRDYTTPYLFIDRAQKLPTDFDHLGYDYLQKAHYPNGDTWHPGADINGPGAGSTDFGQLVKSTVDGEVVYCYAENDRGHGWGKLMVIKQAEPLKDANENAMYQEFLKKLAKVLGFTDFGDTVDESEATKIFDKVDALVRESKEKDNALVDLKSENARLQQQLGDGSPSSAVPVTPAPVTEAPEVPADNTKPTVAAPQVVAVIPPGESKPTLTLGDILRKIFKFK